MQIELNSYWQVLKQGCVDLLNKQQIKSHQHKYYTHTVELIAEFAAQQGIDEYTPDVGYAFFESEKAKTCISQASLDRRRKGIKKLNESFYGNDYWLRQPRNDMKYKTSRQELKCPRQFFEEFERFLIYLGKIGLKQITIDAYRSWCIRILCDFIEQGADSWTDIDAPMLTTGLLHARNKKYYIAYSRRLFGYLKSHGIVAEDYSDILPTIAKRKPIPSVYSEEEIQKLLASIERYTPIGKRNYAMVLIAVRLGLRISDISQLKIENIDFERKRVDFIQFKTSVENHLPLYQEVESAILDYIDNGREPSNEPYIFLNGHGLPVKANMVSDVVTKHFNQTDIDFGSRKKGAHSLRMTFASQLIAEDIPYEVVRSALGHLHRETTRSYVKFDIESLRTCALEVPAPGGKFAEYLAGAEVLGYGYRS